MVKSRKAKRYKSTTAGKTGKSITIRMYNVGFGDCFLVTIPTSDGPRRILFDCGSISAAADVKMDDVLRQIWKDTAVDATHSRIDVVVATHRHKDHVSGFAKPGWERVEVGEVWMPWTEHPTDAEARRIRNSQVGLALELHAGITAKLALAQPGSSLRSRLAQAQALADNALSNAKAMTVLHEGFRGQPSRHFLPERNHSGLEYDASRVLPDVSLFVLGPSRKESEIRDMDPPAGKSYLRLAASRDGGQVPQPFGSEWKIAPNAYHSSFIQGQGGISAVLGQWLTKGLTAAVLPQLSSEDMDSIAKAGEMDNAVAVALDKAVNGTSLMLVLKVGSTHLLFPGDAQWGTWQAAMNDPIARDLLERTAFYKIGHHGSHNATPKEFVEQILPEKTRGMVSTRSIDQWPNIPRQPLLDALTARHCTFARSDRLNTADADAFQHSGSLFVDTEIPIT